MRAVLLLRTTAGALSARCTAAAAAPPCLPSLRGLRRFQSGVATEPPADATEAPEAPPSTPSPTAALEAEVARLKQSLAETSSSRLRALAEMENVRSIARRDAENAKAYAVAGFAKRLLDVVDNLHRALESVPAEARVAGGSGGAGGSNNNKAFALLIEGVSATERDFLKTLSQHGVEAFGKVGEVFDPNRHEALMQVPAKEGEAAGLVGQLLKVGFVLKDRVLRPAQVGVTVTPQ